VIRIWLLGTFQVEIDGLIIPVWNWKSKKALTLFKYLCSRPGTKVPKDKIIELLWSESDPKRSMHNLHNTVYNLRRSLCPRDIDVRNECFIYSANGLYWFDARNGYEIDFVVFQKLIKQAFDMEAIDVDQALELYQQALQLYRGDFLEEDLYEDWTTNLRTNLREQYFELVIHTSQLLVKCRQGYGRAIQICRDALRYDPTRETLHRTIIQYLIDQGRNVDAMLQYRECQKTLADKVGLEPSEETNQMIQRILHRQKTGSTLLESKARIIDRCAFEKLSKSNGQLLSLLIEAPSKAEVSRILTILQRSLRQGDLLCRMSDCEIAVLLAAATEDCAKTVARRLERIILNQINTKVHFEIINWRDSIHTSTPSSL